MNIEDLVRNSVATVPYYRDRYASGTHELSALQPLEKATITASDLAFVSDRYNASDLLLSESSGTSGEPIRMRHTRHEESMSAMSFWRGRRWHGVSSTSAPSCRFYGFTRQASGVGYAHDPIHVSGSTMQFSWFDLSAKSFLEYYDAMLSHEPEWFQASPSVMGRFASFLSERRLAPPPSLRLIELTGEVEQQNDRDAIRAAFPGVGVANSYAAREVWSIAYECPEGSLHVSEDNVHLELVDTRQSSSDSREGTVMVTNKHFAAMPFLRYLLADRVIARPDQCLCGRPGQLIRMVSGRQSEFVDAADGSQVHAHFFHYVMMRINLIWPLAVRRFQVIQKGRDLDILIEPGSAWDEEVPDRVHRLVAERFEQDVNVSVGEVSPEKNGKFRTVVRL